MMTEATPLHRLRIPSVVDMERKCCVMVLNWGALTVVDDEVDVVVRRLGVREGKTCIRVFMLSIGKTTECSEIPAWRQI